MALAQAMLHLGMVHQKQRPRRSGRYPPPSLAPLRAKTGEVPLHLDLLRAELYRILDELAHTWPDVPDEIIQEFEKTWARLKDAFEVPSTPPGDGPF
jgi:hypothetical protein